VSLIEVTALKLKLLIMINILKQDSPNKVAVFGIKMNDNAKHPLKRWFPFKVAVFGITIDNNNGY
jgi:hypothetical protein